MATAVTIPSSYKAAVYDKPGQLSTKIVELETPSPATGEVLVKLQVLETRPGEFMQLTMTERIQGADEASDAGYKTVTDSSGHTAQVGGHEGVGTITKVGPGAEVYGFKVGGRVGIKWLRDICGICGYCIAGEDGLCARQSASGLFQPGTFQQYVTAPARYLTPIPEGLSSEVAAPMLCAGLTSYAALRKSNTKPGDWLVVSGAGGGLGHLVTQLAAKAFGLRVIGIDQASKEKVAKDSGVELFFDVTKSGEDTMGEVRKLTDALGAHAAIVCAASNSAYAQSLELLRPGGTLVGVGMPGGEPVAIATAAPGLIVRKQLRIVGSLLGNRQDAIDVLNLAARGIITLHCQTRRLEDLTRVFEEMESGTLAGRAVLDLDN